MTETLDTEIDPQINTMDIELNEINIAMDDDQIDQSTINTAINTAMNVINPSSNHNNNSINNTINNNINDDNLPSSPNSHNQSSQIQIHNQIQSQSSQITPQNNITITSNPPKTKRKGKYSKTGCFECKKRKIKVCYNNNNNKHYKHYKTKILTKFQNFFFTNSAMKLNQFVGIVKD